MTSRRLSRLALVAALPLILSGCVIAALPIAAGALVANDGLGDVAGLGSGGNRKTDVAQAADAEPAAVRLSVPAVEPSSPELAGSTTPLLAIKPAPSVPAAGPYANFARYALNTAAPLPPGQLRRSALVDQGTLTQLPRRVDCGGQPPAVVVDLDPGAKPFDLDNPPLPAPGLADTLGALRNAGITVLWSTNMPVSSAEKIYTILRASGLDPDRTDRLLLVRTADERKQTRRIAAAKDWCIVAIAGDRHADFDEVFDYLRDPEGPVAQTLSVNLGAGWFLTPPPID